MQKSNWDVKKLSINPEMVTTGDIQCHGHKSKGPQTRDLPYEEPYLNVTAVTVTDVLCHQG